MKTLTIPLQMGHDLQEVLLGATDDDYDSKAIRYLKQTLHQALQGNTVNYGGVLITAPIADTHSHWEADDTRDLSSLPVPQAR